MSAIPTEIQAPLESPKESPPAWWLATKRNGKKPKPPVRSQCIYVNIYAYPQPSDSPDKTLVVKSDFSSRNWSYSLQTKVCENYKDSHLIIQTE